MLKDSSVAPAPPIRQELREEAHGSLIAELDCDVLAFRIAKGAQTSFEGSGERMWRRRGHQHADKRQFSRLLRARRQRLEY
jgi:hypothetical protein